MKVFAPGGLRSELLALLERHGLPKGVENLAITIESADSPIRIECSFCPEVYDTEAEADAFGAVTTVARSKVRPNGPSGS